MHHTTEITGWQLKLEDNLARFRIWSNNIGAFHPATDKRSCDYKLRDAPTAVNRIKELINEIVETHEELLTIVTGQRLDQSNDVAFDDLDETELALLANVKSTSEADELCLSVSDTITNLLKVSALLRKTTTRDRYAKAATKAASQSGFSIPHSYDVQHVREKFPKLEAKPWLLDKLGSAITQRREYLRYIQTHHTKIANEPRGGTEASFLRQRQLIGSSLAPEHVTVSDSPTFTITQASTIQAWKLTMQELRVEDLNDDDDAYSITTSQASFKVKTEGADGLQFHPPRSTK